MTRRDLIGTTIGVTSTALFGNLRNFSLSTRKYHNVIFFLTDDQRFDTLGTMGNYRIKTPHLDKLAEQGTLFRNCFVTTSICPVSRASILTGQHVGRHHVRDFNTPLSDAAFAQTFPYILKERGWYTGFIGKWGLGGDLPVRKYDEFYGFSGQGRYFSLDERGHLTERMGRQAIDFLLRNWKKPFLLSISLKAPHVVDDDPDNPFQPDSRHNGLYLDVEIPQPETARKEYFETLPQFVQSSEGRKRWQTRFSSESLFQTSVKNYYRLISGVDDVVGDIVQKLQKLGIYDNTTIIYSSDNGFFLGEHGLAGKWLMYEESIRVPLIICFPYMEKSRQGVAIDEMVLNIDIAPTILDIADINIPSCMQGKSLKPFILKEQTRWREDWYYEFSFESGGQIPRCEGVRSTEWKYIKYMGMMYEELYNVKNDPYEKYNLADVSLYNEMLQWMRKRLEVLRHEVTDNRCR